MTIARITAAVMLLLAPLGPYDASPCAVRAEAPLSLPSFWLVRDLRSPLDAVAPKPRPVKRDLRKPRPVVSAHPAAIPQPKPRNIIRPYVTFTDAPHTHAGLVAWAAGLGWPWQGIIGCESLRDDTWRVGSPSHARGPFQFLPSSWRLVGGHGDPAAASWREQFTRAKALRRLQGLGAWVCARQLGYT